MPGRLRKATGGIVCHVLNRAVGKLKLFKQDDDYAAFERVLGEACEGTETRLVSCCWPVPRPRDWTRRVNRPLTEKERDSVRGSIRRGRSFGDESWTTPMARQLALESTLRPRGRPRKSKREDDEMT